MNISPERALLLYLHLGIRRSLWQMHLPFANVRIRKKFPREKISETFCIIICQLPQCCGAVHQAWRG